MRNIVKIIKNTVFVSIFALFFAQDNLRAQVDGKNQYNSESLCFLFMQNGNLYFYDDGEVFIDNQFLVKTYKGCFDFPSEYCRNIQNIKFFPDKLSYYDYSAYFTAEACKDNVVHFNKEQLKIMRLLEWAAPYVKNVQHDNSVFYRKAQEITKDCPLFDTDCVVYEIYQYVIGNLKYFPDPDLDQEFIATPFETINRGGGDCEDLTGVLNSLLSNMQVENYVVLTDKHAYTMACGVDIEKMRMLVKNSFERYRSEENIYEVAPNSFLFLSYDSAENLQSTVEISFSSNVPIEVLAVPADTNIGDYNSKTQISKYYSECSIRTASKWSHKCQLPLNISWIIGNTTEQPAQVNWRSEVKYNIASLQKISLHYYEIKDQNCIVLEATASGTGYPGFEPQRSSQMIVINPLNSEWFLLK